jgi:hypothetical protein
LLDYDMQLSGKAASSTNQPQPATKSESKPQPKTKRERQTKKTTNPKKVVVDTKWMAVMVLSTFFGFLALDRFFLRQYKWAIWKLLTLGGLGMWWIADVIYFGIKSDDFKSIFQNTSQIKNYSRIVAVCSTSWLIIVCLVMILLFVPSLSVQPVVSIQATNSIVGTTFTGKGTGFSHSGWVTLEITGESPASDFVLPLVTKSYRADSNGTIAFVFNEESEIVPGRYSCKAIDKNTGIFTSSDFEVFRARFRR